MKQHVFSEQLTKWLHGHQPKTLAALNDVFAEKSLAIAILLLMCIPALPIPTGGITHIFELITMLLALELIAGRRSIWLPKKWQSRTLGNLAEKKVLPTLTRLIRFFERFARPRFSRAMKNQNSLRFVGLLTLIFTIFAFVSPPFSGLDTLPSLGVVILMLAVILEDGLILVIGTVVGIVGAILTISLGVALTESLKHFF